MDKIIKLGLSEESEKGALVHISTERGHRASYCKLFLGVLSADVSIGPIFSKEFRRIVRSPFVFFPTIDDDYFGFLLASMIRAACGKRTSGIFIRALQCFRANRPVLNLFKQLVFRFLKNLPGLKIYSIIPHPVSPELKKVTSDWIYDPQMWDLWLQGRPRLPSSKLSERVEAKRCGRKVAIFIGSANLEKRFDKFAEWAGAAHEKILFVSAGRVSSECGIYSRRLQKLDMIVEDSFVTDDEILSLYKVADYAWCSYAPEYDQASGVFGRAIQTGVDPILRVDSVPFNILKYCIKDFGNGVLDPADLVIYSMRDRSLSVIRSGFEN